MTAKKPSSRIPAADQKIAVQAKGAAGNLAAQRIAAAGQTTRIHGHVSARNKRNQGKRDSS